MIRVLVVERDPTLAWLYQEELEEAGFSVGVFNSLDGALKSLRKSPPDVLLTDVSSIGENLRAWLPQLRTTFPGPMVLIGGKGCDLPAARELPRAPKSSDLSHLISLVRGQALKVMWSKAAAGSC